jgi:hypothetical protein
VKFEVRYPQGEPHDVELQGTVAVLGRDPSCDLVLSDSKCSRRHAVLEAGPQGIVIRDAGSANGVFVNDKKVERAALNEGDVIKLGDVVLRVLPEEMPSTLMMSPEDMEAGAPAAAATVPPVAPPVAAPAAPPASRRPAAAQPSPPPPAPSPRSRPEPRARPLPSSAPARPLTVTLLAGLWLASILLYGLGGVLTAHALDWHGAWAAAPIATGVFLALISAVMAYGLWSLAPWARVLQIVLAVFGLFVCPFTLASIAVLVYMSRAAARAAFAGRRPQGAGGPDAAVDTSSEPAFAAVILGTVLLGVVASGTTLALGRRGGSSMEQAHTSAREEAAVGRLQRLAAAEGEFRSGTCVSAYADLEGLLNPGSAIPNYPPNGPAFLPPEFARADALGYRFDLTVEDAVPPSEGCAARGFRRFAYAATPQDAGGRHLVVGPDGVVHAAKGRPATFDDPVVH